jgi:hypothetical protein
MSCTFLDVFNQPRPLNLPQICRIEVFPNSLHLEGDASGGVILQDAAVFDDLVPEQRRRLIEDYEIEIVALHVFCQFFHEFQPVIRRLYPPIEVNGNVRVTERAGLAARSRSEQIGKLYPLIIFKYWGQVSHFSVMMTTDAFGKNTAPPSELHQGEIK